MFFLCFRVLIIGQFVHISVFAAEIEENDDDFITMVLVSTELTYQ